jgi:hypothetical protein
MAKQNKAAKEQPKVALADSQKTDSSESVQAEGGATGESVALPLLLDTAEKAFEYAKDLYPQIEGKGEFYVTADGQAFLKENEGSAYNHAVSKGLKIFKLQWD